jgi:hypothetical protein
MQARVGFGGTGKRLQIFVRPIQRMLKVANSPAGLATLVSELLAIDPALIVLEATSTPRPARPAMDSELAFGSRL